LICRNILTIKKGNFHGRKDLTVSVMENPPSLRQIAACFGHSVRARRQIHDDISVFDRKLVVTSKKKE